MMLRPTKYRTIRQAQQKPWELYPATEHAFQSVAQVSDEIFVALKDAIGMGTEMWREELLLMPVSGRALENIDSFISAAETWNISVASTLIRLQIDNLMIGNLLAVSPDPGGVVKHILDGKELNKLPLPPELVELIPEDRRERRMTHREWVLQILAAERFAWVPDAYKAASGYVHFSSEHPAQIFKIDSENILNGRVPAEISQFSEDYISNLVTAMLEASQAMVSILNGWGEEKKRRATAAAPSDTKSDDD